MRTVLVGLVLLLAGCGVPEAALMTTPLIYQSDGSSVGLDPLAHLDPSLRTTSQRVFFATNRARAGGRFDGPLNYSNTPTPSLQLGMARVRFGDETTWDELHAASRVQERDPSVPLRLVDLWEHGSARFEGAEYEPDPTDGVDHFVAAINRELAAAKDPELIIYVHGAKVNFYNACVYAAELNHFAGRDMVAVAFAWPTHQDILSYLSGEDIARARGSVEAFEGLLRLLARRTTAERINIVCWSAGGRVVSRALADLAHWEDRLEEDPSACRLGTVLFAAPDVSVHDFVERLPGIERVAERVIVTASDDDIALAKASQFMGGGRRIGTSGGPMPDEERAALEHAQRLELVDVSAGRDERGFDIGGHRYWFSHEWVASDVVLAVRTRLPASERGLAPAGIPNVWYFPADYPRRVREAAARALGPTW